jgi:TPR repeat protein
MSRPWRSLALAAGITLVAASGASARTPDLAYGAYQTGHYRRAVQEALKRIEADSTDAAAMTLLGEIYRQGLGVPEDPVAATEWYARAAERGDINAVYALAIALLGNAGSDKVATDPARAGRLLEQAAAAGHPAANYNLALTLLATGEPQDEARAIACLEIAAGSDIGEALHALGILAKQGRGMPQSDATAAGWMARAAAAGHLPGEVEYAIMLFNGTGVAKDEAAAARLFLRAAGKGNPIAQNRLARLYQAGRGIPTDSIEAAAWHLAARARGLDDPQLDQLFDRLNPEQQGRAAALAATRIEGAALTSSSQASK